MTPNRNRSLVAPAVTALVAAVVVAAGPAPSALAAPPASHMSPANTPFSVTQKTDTSIKLVTTIDGISVTTTCTSLGASGRTPSDGLHAALSNPPRIGGCTDDLGGNDTVSGSGSWNMGLSSSGTQVTLVGAPGGLKLSSTVFPGCVVTTSPTYGLRVVGSYNKFGTGFMSSSLPVSGSGCTTSGQQTITATIVVSPYISVVS